MYRFLRNNLLIGLTITILLFLSWPVQAQDQLTSRLKTIIEQYYVDSIPSAVESAATTDQLLKALGDPYAQYFTQNEFKQFKEVLDQTFVGIGIVFELVPEGIMVKSVIAQSPADLSGIKVGDIIKSVNDISLAGLSSEAVSQQIRGPEGSQVSLQVLRGKTTINFLIKRQSIDIPSITSQMLPNQIGYINISAFSSDTAEQFGEAAALLQQQGAKSWIIDLRDNGGGYLEASRQIAGYFIPGQICMLTDSRYKQSQPIKATTNEYQISGKVILLVNGNTASASEILTGALQDHNRALVIGQKTFGKGSVQWLFNLGNDGIFKLTCEKYRTPLGREVNTVGITPDLSTEVDNLKMAELILSGQAVKTSEKTTLIRIKGVNYPINLDQAKSAAYKNIYHELLQKTARTPQRSDFISGLKRFYPAAAVI